VGVVTDAELVAALAKLDRSKLDREERHFVDFVTRKASAGAGLSRCNRKRAMKMAKGAE
jgi:hypothetical protein